jgi:YegS/Rv2252/BmrU family lipid kinase
VPKLFVIFNPVARGNKARRLRDFLEAQTRPDVILAPTVAAGDATRLAEQGVRQGYQTIVAAGGDGTVNEVLNGIGTAPVTLGVLPIGTVNVFAREFGIPLQLEAAWQVLHTGQPTTLDLVCAEYGNRRRYFVQLAGVGFDAHVVRTNSWELKKRVGPFSYVWAGLTALHHHHPEVIVSDDQGERSRGVAVFIGNGRFYGGPFRLFPQAEMNDGRLDVCVFSSVAYGDLLRYGWGILWGRHLRMRGVTYFQSAAFTCTPATAESVPFELDGEDAGMAPVRFSVLPHSLRVVVPVKRPRSGSSS